MNSTTLFLLLLLPPADTSGDLAAGIQASLHAELGDVSLAVAPDTLVTPSMWQGERAQMHPRFVVRLSWRSPDEAEIGLIPGNGAAPNYNETRTLKFSAQDSASERGRAIGLVTAELLRSSPAAVWADGKGGAISAPRAFGIAAMMVMERPASGTWAYGPGLSFTLGLAETFRLGVSTIMTFAPAQGDATGGGRLGSYQDIGATLDATWDFLFFARKRLRLGLGLDAGFFHESATISVGSATNDHGIPSQGLTNSSLAGTASLRASFAPWTFFRVFAEAGIRGMSGALSGRVTQTSDDNRTPATFAIAFPAWRPVFSAGLELRL